ncbi:MAG: amidohydrolase family protein [Anaerolineales bacterium]|nr:amidohydrolase family protein [Anaerolineales bacterium]
MDKQSDLVLKNGSIYTVDQDRTWAEAIAISGEKIIFVGSDEAAESFIGMETEVIDLERKMVLPGFIDSHAHPSHAVDLVSNINLHMLDTLEEYKRAIAGFVDNHPNADTFRGRGWSDTLFPKLGPTSEILDAIVPDRPIAIVSYDGHSLWVNSVTLERAGINKDTPDPDGGRIERHPATGQPSGTLRETASKLVESVIPDYSIEERKKALLAYQDMALSVGITMSHDAMLDIGSIAAFNALAEEGRLKMRFRGAITMEPYIGIKQQIEMVVNERSKNTHPFFQTHTAKIFVDGVVEGGSAYLLEPYEHEPEYRGKPIWGPDSLNNACVALDHENIQIHFHVIGDAAARMTLDALEGVKKTKGRLGSRHLATHLQLVKPEDIPRFKELCVIGVPQPFWFKIDNYYRELALPYLGRERADSQYPMQSFIVAGVIMASGSDFPVTIPFDPLIAIQIGITRSDIAGKSREMLSPEERASLEDMITSFTYNGAYANFVENEIGSIEVGKQADVIVLDQNLFNIPVHMIAKTKVILTLVDGIEVFRDAVFP